LAISYFVADETVETAEGFRNCIAEGDCDEHVFYAGGGEGQAEEVRAGENAD